MKKVLITICAAIAVLACTKTEVAFDEPNEIAFSPVSKFETKAAVGATYSSNLNFYAWAYTVETTPVAYFSEILFTPESSQDGAPTGLTSYTGSTPQYWPNEKALKFAGVTKSGNITKDIVAMSDATAITVTGYDQPLPNSAVANDLLWFFDDNSDAGYTKPEANATSVHVQPTMKHACSWVVVKVALDSDLASYWTNVKVNSIKFVTLLTTGDVTLTEGGASWDDQGTSESNIVVYEGTTEITTTAKEFAASNDAIVIPQTPTTLAVNISYTTPAGGAVTETIDEISLDYDGAEGTNTAWAPGKKYTYTLTICADEIKIAPKSEDWSAYDADSTTDGVQNIEKDVK